MQLTTALVATLAALPICSAAAVSPRQEGIPDYFLQEVSCKGNDDCPTQYRCNLDDITKSVVKIAQSDPDRCVSCLTNQPLEEELGPRRN
jgi:hypothetical protein